ncbi:MAG TPA: sigma-70 family RNA polymerase sigma factor [Chitinophagaceae bacterium]|nr:sigma-70 family RNA polymerase sigma factor [Chitinophagaceae bacterium]
MNNSTPGNIPDHDLLEHFYSSRDNQWLGILLQRYTLLLLGVCMKYLKNEDEAKDTVQQIFLKVITELQKYRVDYFKSWLYMIARNQCLMQLRDKNGKASAMLTDKLALPDEDSHIADLAEKDKLLTVIENALQELNEEQKTCVTLFYLQKKSYSEISDQTGLTLLQVKSHIQNGKRNLRLLVEKKMK